MEVDPVDHQNVEAEFNTVAELVEETAPGVPAAPATPTTPAGPVKRGRGRPKKTDSPVLAAATKSVAANTSTPTKGDSTASYPSTDVAVPYSPDPRTPITPKRRGRPAGSTNKIKTPAEKPTPTKRSGFALRTGQWEAPLAPNRMGRPLTKLQHKIDFSIGLHLTESTEWFKAEEARVVAQAEQVPFPQYHATLENAYIYNEQEAQTFMPGKAESQPITLTECPIDVSGLKPFRVGRFGAERKDNLGNDFFLNAGGPVNDLAWCPQPFGLSEETCPPPELMHSFLAISTFRDMEEPHPLGDFTPSKRNIIQIWDLGSLNNVGSNDNDFVPFMTLALTHEMDFVQQIVWCPVATPQPNDEAQFRAEEGQLARLGLLAAVLADGSVSVFSVPHPHAVHLELDHDRLSRRTIYINLPPVITLVTPDRSHIRSIAWSHLNGGASLAAATLDGKLAVWTLPLHETTRAGIASPMQPLGNDGMLPINANTCPPATSVVAAAAPSSSTTAVGASSPSLSSSTAAAAVAATAAAAPLDISSRLFGLSEVDPLGLYETMPPSIPLYWNDPVFVPTFFRKTHSAPTTSIQWHSADPDVIAIGIAHAPLLLWNIKNPSCSLSTTQILGGLCTEIAFTGADTNYAILVSSDDGSTRMIAPPTYRMFETHKDPCTTIDYSRLIRLQVSAGLDGLVYLTAVYDNKKTALFTRKLPPGVFIDKVDLNPSDSTLKFSYSTISCANTLSPSTPDTGEPKKKKNEKKKDEPKVERPFKDQATFITKVRWSPNIRTPSWLAYGTRAGIVRVQSVVWTNPPLL